MEYQSLQECLQEISAELDKEVAASAPPPGTAAVRVSVADGVADADDGGASSGISGASGASATTSASLAAQSPTLRSLPADQREHWYAQAQRMVSAHVKLVTEPTTATNLAKALQASPVGKLTGTDRADCVLILYDPKQSGEAITQPHLRCAPLRDDHLAKHLGGALEARHSLQAVHGGTGGGMEVLDGDVICLFDGGRHGELANLNVPRCLCSSGGVLGQWEGKLFD